VLGLAYMGYQRNKQKIISVESNGHWKKNFTDKLKEFYHEYF